MPQKAWSAKRERQYDHIVEEARDRGIGTERAKEIASRTVNKERARTGEARESSRLSRTDMPSGRRGAQRASRRGGPRGRTVEQLRNEARSLNIRGRSRMNKAQLVAAINRKRS
jgi:hypothetical protein